MNTRTRSCCLAIGAATFNRCRKLQQTDVTKKILIIDDSIEHIKILIALLEHQYDVYFAKSGKQGLELLPSINPDLILLDIVMPEMDGFAVCREIKLNEQWREIPIIFISAQIADEDETAGLELGAIDYVTKPFKPAIVQARMVRIKRGRMA